jgi:hypothetical protein
MTAGIRISEDVLSQEVAGETVLLDLARKTGMLKEAIVDTLLADYDVGREELETDVADLLDQLEAAGLITRD